MASFWLKIIASDKVFFNGRCHNLIVPAIDGELAFMAHHQSMVVAIETGPARYQLKEGGEWTNLVVGTGFVHVAHNRLSMIVDTAERPEDIDRVRAEAALAQAQEQLRQKQSIQEYHISKASLARAMVRIKEASRWQI